MDAGYAGDTVHRKSMSGFMVKLRGAVCSWNAKKSSSIALSTCESAHYAMTMAAQEAIWARRVMDEAGLKVNEPTTLRTGKQGAVCWATGDRFQ